MAQSNFKALFDNRKNQQSPAPSPTKPKKEATQKKAKTISAPPPSVAVVPVETKEVIKTKGKPLAKSKDPHFIQGNFYIRKNTHAKAKIKLLQEGDERDLSDLVEELLTSWLSS